LRNERSASDRNAVSKNGLISPSVLGYSIGLGPLG